MLLTVTTTHRPAWWQELTGRGGKGMVVKPLSFVARDGRGLLQPAVECRGSEYLRIIYGLDYDAPENLERLRARGLGAKRALGIEGLERFSAAPAEHAAARARVRLRGAGARERAGGSAALAGATGT